jgi:hypothetical protein
MSGPGPQPPGWQPPHNPQGWQQPPGWQQQQPPTWQPQQQWPPYAPQPPKKKSNAPKVLLITAVVLVVLGAIGVAAWRFMYISGDAGADPGSGTPPEQCAVDAKILDSANVSVFTSGRTDGNRTSCGYATRKGGDGVTVRTVDISVMSIANADLSDDTRLFDSYIAERNPGYQAKPGPKLGDKSMFYAHEQNNHTYLTLGVRKGNTLYKIGLYGYTKGFFGDTAAPLDQAEKDLTAIAGDLVK